MKKVFKQLTYCAVSMTLMTSSAIASQQYDKDSEIGVTITVNPEAVFHDLFATEIEGLSNGFFRVSPHKLVKAFEYSPAKGEPSVIDLINEYRIFGLNEMFWNKIKKLSDRGNPNAWSFLGLHLAFANMASKNVDYHRGIELLKMASDVGISDADNSLGLLLDYAGQKDAGLKFLAKGVNLPHDRVNFALLEAENVQNPKTLADLMKAAEAGDPCGANALGDYYAQAGPDQDSGEALKWYLISYHGNTSMDSYAGFETMIAFMSKVELQASMVQRIKRDVAKWLNTHPQAFTDGFDQDRLAARPNYTVKAKESSFDEDASVQSLFWETYAVGNRQVFADEIEPFVLEGDANGLYMKAHLLRGFVGPVSESKRRSYLEEAVSKYHPLACLELGIDLWMDGALASGKERTRLYERAFETLSAGYDRWVNTEYKDVIADLTFFLGYFTEKGIGATMPNKNVADSYYREVADTSALAMGYLARSTKNPVQSYAYMLASKPCYTQGDWFGGVHPWQQKMTELSDAQKIQATKLADAILRASPALSLNIYQKLSEGLDPAFSGN